MAFFKSELIERLWERKTERGLTWQQVADEASVPARVLLQLRNGEGVSLRNGLMLARWAGFRDVSRLTRQGAMLMGPRWVSPTHRALFVDMFGCAPEEAGRPVLAGELDRMFGRE